MGVIIEFEIEKPWFRPLLQKITKCITSHSRILLIEMFCKKIDIENVSNIALLDYNISIKFYHTYGLNKKLFLLYIIYYDDSKKGERTS